MKKVIGLITITAFAAIGTLGLAAQAAVAFDPQDDCAGGQYGVKNAWVDTSPSTQFAASEVYGGAVLCGSDTAIEHGYTGGKIESPALVTPAGTTDQFGMEFRCANPAFPSACTTSTDLPSGTFVSEAEMDVMAFWNGNYFSHIDNDHSKIYVNQAPGGPPNTDCAATYQNKPVVQCLQGKDDLGWGTSNIIVTKYQSGSGAGANTGRYRLNIIQPVATGGQLDLYYTKIGKRGSWNGQTGVPDPTDNQMALHICKYAGAVNGSTCGTNPADWLQINGRKGFYVQCGPVQEGLLPAPYGWVITGFRNWSGGMNPNGCANDKWTQTQSASFELGKGELGKSTTLGKEEAAS